MAINKISNLHVYEVLKNASRLSKKEDRISYLRENNSLGLRDVLKIAFDDAVKLDLPEGVPPYDPAKPESVPSSLKKLTKRFRYLVFGNNVNQMKKETIFIGMLEVMHPEDALLVIAAKDKALDIKGITKSLIKEAFPGLISK